jgi:CrcB protein
MSKLNVFFALLVAMGAGLGAMLRWFIGIYLNPLLVYFPMGTLVVNALGGFFMGIALVYLVPASTAWKLFCMVGFLGGFTTFSAFAAESLFLLQESKILLAFLHMLLHTVGTVMFTAVGYYLSIYLIANQ